MLQAGFAAISGGSPHSRRKTDWAGTGKAVGDAPGLPFIVGDEAHAQAQGMRGDQEIHGANRQALSLQCRPDRAIGHGRLAVEISHVQRGQKLLQGLPIPLRLAALDHALLKFGQGDDRDADVAEGEGAESIQFERLRRCGPGRMALADGVRRGSAYQRIRTR